MKYAFISIGVMLLCCNGNGQIISSHVIDSMTAGLKHCTSDSGKAVLRAAISLELAETFPDSALCMAGKGLADAKTAKNQEAYAFCLESIGWCYFKKENHDSAKYYYAESIDLYHRLHQSYREAHVLINLSTLYEYENNFEKVLDCCLKAVNLMEGQQHPLARALVYVASKKYNSAFIFFRERGLAHLRRNYTAGEEGAYSKIADAFLARNNGMFMQTDADSALQYYRRAYSLALKTGRTSEQAWEKLGIGRALFLKRKYDEADRYLNESLMVFIKERLFDGAYEVTLEINKLYKEKGEFKKAAGYLLLSVVYKDSLDAVNRKEIMANMFARYEAEKKDKTIQLLNAQKALAAKELSGKRVVEFFSFCLIALIIVLGIVLWKQGRIKQQLKEIRIRNQVAADLHDEIGSSLSSILLLSNMATKGNGKNERKFNLDKIGFTAREVIGKVSDIVWIMNPRNDSGASIKERIDKLVLEIRDMSSLQVDVNISKRLEELVIHMELRRNIFLICKEALHNIVKHADATIVSLSIYIGNKQIVLEIKDNGRGFDPDSHRTGNGLRSMEHRVMASGGEFRVVTAPGRGSCIQVALPAPHPRYIFS
jgi:signal transduction histidine kinase